MAKILVLNGPNLNLLGLREPDVYGHDTLDAIQAGLLRQVKTLGHELLWFQSNAEHALVERIHQARNEQVAIILCNAAAFTHTSLALRDALLGVAIPFIEIHLSNVFSREEFRHHSYLADRAIGVIAGFGSDSYRLALDVALHRLTVN